MTSAAADFDRWVDDRLTVAAAGCRWCGRSVVAGAATLAAFRDPLTEEPAALSAISALRRLQGVHLLPHIARSCLKGIDYLFQN